MPGNRLLYPFTVLLAVCLVTPAAFAQPEAAPTPSAPATSPSDLQSAPAPGVGVGVALRASTLGIGVEGALRVHRRVNVRVGVNRFTYSREFDDSDSEITYQGTLSLQSVAAYVDWFPFGGGFHISPGLTIRNRNKVGLETNVPAGETVSIDDVDYLSAAANPIRGDGDITVGSTRSALVIGWGNLVPRSRRFSVPFELGVIFQGAPIARLSFAGTACEPSGRNCRDMTTDPTIQGHVRGEEARLNDDLGLGALRFYPVLSLGFAVRF